MMHKSIFVVITLSLCVAHAIGQVNNTNNGDPYNITTDTSDWYYAGNFLCVVSANLSSSNQSLTSKAACAAFCEFAEPTADVFLSTFLGPQTYSCRCQRNCSDAARLLDETDETYVRFAKQPSATTTLPPNPNNSQVNNTDNGVPYDISTDTSDWYFAGNFLCEVSANLSSSNQSLTSKAACAAFCEFAEPTADVFLSTFLGPQSYSCLCQRNCSDAARLLDDTEETYVRFAKQPPATTTSSPSNPSNGLPAVISTGTNEWMYVGNRKCASTLNYTSTAVSSKDGCAGVCETGAGFDAWYFLSTFLGEHSYDCVCQADCLGFQETGDVTMETYQRAESPEPTTTVDPLNPNNGIPAVVSIGLTEWRYVGNYICTGSVPFVSSAQLPDKQTCAETCSSDTLLTHFQSQFSAADQVYTTCYCHANCLEMRASYSIETELYERLPYIPGQPDIIATDEYDWVYAGNYECPTGTYHWWDQLNPTTKEECAQYCRSNWTETTTMVTVYHPELQNFECWCQMACPSPDDIVTSDVYTEFYLRNDRTTTAIPTTTTVQPYRPGQPQVIATDIFDWVYAGNYDCPTGNFVPWDGFSVTKEQCAGLCRSNFTETTTLVTIYDSVLRNYECWCMISCPSPDAVVYVDDYTEMYIRGERTTTAMPTTTAVQPYVPGQPQVIATDIYDWVYAGNYECTTGTYYPPMEQNPTSKEECTHFCRSSWGDATTMVTVYHGDTQNYECWCQQACPSPADIVPMDNYFEMYLRGERTTTPMPATTTPKPFVPGQPQVIATDIYDWVYAGNYKCPTAISFWWDRLNPATKQECAQYCRSIWNVTTTMMTVYHPELQNYECFCQFPCPNPNGSVATDFYTELYHRRERPEVLQTGDIQWVYHGEFQCAGTPENLATSDPANPTTKQNCANLCYGYPEAMVLMLTNRGGDPPVFACACKVACLAPILSANGTVKIYNRFVATTTTERPLVPAPALRTGWISDHFVWRDNQFVWNDNSTAT